VLGSHSYGSYVATLFAQAYPDDIVGLVFVDPRAPRVSSGWRVALPPKTDDEPDSIAVFRDELETFETDPSLNDEHLDLKTSGEQAIAALDAAGPLFGDRPVIVLSADRERNGWSDLPPELASTFGSIWSDGQQELADESTDGTFTKVPDVGHSIHVEEPAVVIAALEEVLGEVVGP
jgi:pimeloyl-ACP methyl ester carboxylesterase